MMEPSGYDEPYATDEASADDDRMHFMRAYQYVFDQADWVMTVLLLSICRLIPVIGSLLMIGYQFEIVEALHRRPDAEYPKFDFNKFMAYLTRGVWPFLVYLIVSVAASILLAPLWLCAGLMPALMDGGGNADAAVLPVVLLMIGGAFVMLVVTLLMALVIVPMMIRAGLAQDFAAAFDMAFVKDFARRVWKEIILETLFLVFSALVLIVLGMALCCIGVYPAGALIYMAQAHLYHQLYTLYLARGGTPIPLKEPPPNAPPVVVR